MTRLIAAWLVVAACCGVARTAEPTAEAKPLLTFGLVGDAPYDPREEAEFTTLLGRLQDEPLAFIVHVGDMKSSGSICDDAAFQSRRRLFDRSAHPFVFVPGDNDWTDCWQQSAGGFDPVERLQALRRIMIPEGRVLGQRPLSLMRQAAYPENARWSASGVVLATFNVPGPDNHYRRMPAEYMSRNAANIAWLREAFAEARRARERAVVLVLQGNMFAPPPAASRENRLGYTEFLDVLSAEAATFRGPVLLANGDTHRFRVDQPLLDEAGRPRANFTRVESFGSPNVDWVRIDVVETPRGAEFRILPRGRAQ